MSERRRFGARSGAELEEESQVAADKQKSPGEPTQDERGKRASFDPKSGEVHGSGSGAGGGGNPNEDYDSDPMAGAGAEPQGGPRPRSKAVDRPIDPDEGV
jgi:hypothetical protein